MIEGGMVRATGDAGMKVVLCTLENTSLTIHSLYLQSSAISTQSLIHSCLACPCVFPVENRKADIYMTQSWTSGLRPVLSIHLRGKTSVMFGSGSSVIHIGKINVFSPQVGRDTHG